MNLTLNGLTALRVIRAIRGKALSGNLQRRCDLASPDPSPSARWTKNRLVKAVDHLRPTIDYPSHKLDVLVGSSDQRLQTKGVRCTYRTREYPSQAFVDTGNGIVVSGPELVFVELARVMDPAVHLLLGMELCGRFSRSAINPRSGTVTYDIEPATSVERLRAFAREAHWIRGAEQALATIDEIVENAWSPTEALIAALITLPHDSLGYDLWPIILNSRKELGERLVMTSDVSSRVPDILVAGTNVGLNYDGKDHFRLEEIADAAVALDRDPGNVALARELERALHDARARIVADKRRDRDLMAMGYTIFSVTKEDLEEQGGFDRVMMQVIEAIEASGKRDLSELRRVMSQQDLARARQDFIWSLMPGARAIEARRRLEVWRRIESHDFEIEFTMIDGKLRIISMREL